MDTSQNSTVTEVEQSLDLLAKKFALLLAASDIDEELQQAFIGLLPHLELEQIIHLVSMLEAKYAASKTIALDEELKEKLETISKNFDDRQKARDGGLVDFLDNFAPTTI